MLDAGVPAEDARFLIPNAAHTNFKITVNLQSLLHICDLRLCTRAQWEFRKVDPSCARRSTASARSLPATSSPSAASAGWATVTRPSRLAEVPIGRKRPHKRELFALYDSYRKGELAPLQDDDYLLIEASRTSPRGKKATERREDQDRINLVLDKRVRDGILTPLVARL